MNHNHSKRWMLGFVLIAAGVIFFLQQWGYIDFDLGDMIRTFWPLILVFVGLSGLLQGGFWGIIPFGIGVYYLLRNLGIIMLSWSEFMRYGIPFALIAGGLWVLLKPKRFKHNKADWSSERENWNSNHDSQSAIHDEPQGPAPISYPDYSDPNYPDPFKNVDYSNDLKHRDLDEQIKAQQQGMNNTFDKEKLNKSPSSKSWQFDMNTGTDYSGHKGKTINRSAFIGDFHIGQDYWELKPMNISHFIGDTTIDLTKAQVPYGETKINVSSFIGDVKVYVPRDVDLGIRVTSSSFLGDVRLLDQKESGFMRSVEVESPYYRESDRKVRIIVSTFIGDVKVKKVG